MGSGELRVTSGTPKLMEGKFAYNVADWKPVVDYRAGGASTGELKHFAAEFERQQLR